MLVKEGARSLAKSLPERLGNAAHSCVHALATGRRMNMRRISGEKYAPHAVLRGHSNIDAVERQPGGVLQLKLCEGFDLIVENIPIAVFDFRNCSPIELDP